MAIRGQGMAAEEEEGGSGEGSSAAAAAADAGRIVYVLHPNCAVEEY
jgi:DNA replication licensing factor MCM6